MALKVISTPNPNPVDPAVRAQYVANPGFGKYFTDHMIVAKWSEANGWEDASLESYGPLVLDPATMVFHYGQEIFEGLKAYKQPDGSISLFRPEANAERFNRSAKRLALPELPDGFFVECVKELVKADRNWVPGNPGEALYIRPFMIATEVAIGVHASKEAKFIIIATPVGAYFDASKTVSVWISTEYVRAAPGGTGEAKCGGNYAASLVAQKAAAAEGCDQVIWLDAIERKWIEEMGGMNLCFVKGKGKDATLFTPKLTGTLLAGITRNSILSVAKEMGYQVEEGMISVDQLRAGLASGEISEVFACGTAAVISPIGVIKSAQGVWQVGDGSAGEISMAIRKEVLNIQHGLVSDPHGWNVKVC
jgi:branched-chain amino acid aminotransferase